MSLTGILAGGLLNLLGAGATHNSSAANPSSNSPGQTEFQQLGQDLQSGNLSSARQDFAAIDQSVRQRTAQILHHHHHFAAGTQYDAANTLAQEFSTLAQALQSGNVSAAQAAFSALEQGLNQPTSPLGPSAVAGASQTASNSVNFLA
jgi:hypothetical protein